MSEEEEAAAVVPALSPSNSYHGPGTTCTVAAKRSVRCGMGGLRLLIIPIPYLLFREFIKIFDGYMYRVYSTVSILRFLVLEPQMPPTAGVVGKQDTEFERG